MMKISDQEEKEMNSQGCDPCNIGGVDIAVDTSP